MFSKDTSFQKEREIRNMMERYVLEDVLRTHVVSTFKGV